MAKMVKMITPWGTPITVSEERAKELKKKGYKAYPTPSDKKSGGK